MDSYAELCYPIVLTRLGELLQSAGDQTGDLMASSLQR